MKILFPFVKSPQLFSSSFSTTAGSTSTTSTSLPSFKHLLHQFYLKIHPDLFHSYPKEQLTNTNSLALLQSYIQDLQQGKIPSTSTKSTTFSFYHLDSSSSTSTSTSNPLRTIKISFEPLPRWDPPTSLGHSSSSPSSTLASPVLFPPYLRQVIHSNFASLFESAGIKSSSFVFHSQIYSSNVDLLTASSSSSSSSSPSYASPGSSFYSSHAFFSEADTNHPFSLYNFLLKYKHFFKLTTASPPPSFSSSSLSSTATEREDVYHDLKMKNAVILANLRLKGISIIFQNSTVSILSSSDKKEETQEDEEANGFENDDENIENDENDERKSRFYGNTELEEYNKSRLLTRLEISLFNSKFLTAFEHHQHRHRSQHQHRPFHSPSSPSAIASSRLSFVEQIQNENENIFKHQQQIEKEMKIQSEERDKLQEKESSSSFFGRFVSFFQPSSERTSVQSSVASSASLGESTDAFTRAFNSQFDSLSASSTPRWLPPHLHPKQNDSSPPSTLSSLSSVIVFSSISSLSHLDSRGRIVLSSFKDSQEWSSLLSNPKIFEEMAAKKQIFHQLKETERKVSNHLGFSSDQAIFADPRLYGRIDYRSFLDRLLTASAKDEFSRLFSIKPDLRELSIRIESSKANSPFLDPSSIGFGKVDPTMGFLQLPACSSPDQMITFMVAHGDLAIATQREWQKESKYVEQLELKVKRKFLLKSLTRDPDIVLDQMRICCEKLMCVRGAPVAWLTRLHVHVSDHFNEEAFISSGKSVGLIKIPWNFV